MKVRVTEEDVVMESEIREKDSTVGLENGGRGCDQRDVGSL